MKIGKHDTDEKVFIIAEIGSNHNGDFKTACHLIAEAAKAGVDAVKFQTYIAEKLVHPSLPVISHASGVHKTQAERLKSLEFSRDQWNELKDFSIDHKVTFLSTCFDEESLALIEPWVPAFKVASGDLTNKPLIRRMVETGKPILLSTGMAASDEIERAISELPEDQRVLLHCVSKYPTKPSDANLKSVSYLKDKFKCVVGYSDHTEGILACVGAVALGARVIEKHFTLDKKQPLGDHRLSAEPVELKELVQKIRLLETMLGFYGKPVAGEELMQNKLRRSLATTRALKCGTVLQASDLIAIRPGEGISPWDLDRVVGKVCQKDIGEGAFLSWSDFN